MDAKSSSDFAFNNDLRGSGVSLMNCRRSERLRAANAVASSTFVGLDFPLQTDEPNALTRTGPAAERFWPGSE